MEYKIKTYTSYLAWIHRAIDIFVPFIILLASMHLYNVPWQNRYALLGILGGFIFITSAQMLGLYDSWRERPVITNVQTTLNAWLMTWVFLVVLAFLFKDSSNYSRGVLLIWAVITPATFILYRLFFRMALSHIRKLGKNSKRIAIVGAGKIGTHLSQVIHENKWLGYQVIGFYDDKKEVLDSNISNLPVIGTTDKLCDDAKNLEFDEVYLCLPLRAENKIKQLLNDLTETTVAVKYIPDLFTFDLMHAKWTDIKGLPIVSVYDTPLNSNASRVVKRAEDILLSSLILIFISPIMFLIAIGVKSSSPGPIFYRQTRVGWNGKNFQMLKFRSMPVDVEKSGIKWGGAKGKANTRFGKFIRSTSLDELPQFLNVLKGDMSIVGPRPERDIFVEQFKKEIPRYMQKHMVKAGITGWAQVNGWRGDTSLEKRVEFDLHYINNWSLWLDIKIIILTMFKGFINKNAS